jgi:hypothetical protein
MPEPTASDSTLGAIESAPEPRYFTHESTEQSSELTESLTPELSNLPLAADAAEPIEMLPANATSELLTPDNLGDIPTIWIVRFVVLAVLTLALVIRIGFACKTYITNRKTQKTASSETELKNTAVTETPTETNLVSKRHVETDFKIAADLRRVHPIQEFIVHLDSNDLNSASEIIDMEHQEIKFTISPHVCQAPIQVGDTESTILGISVLDQTGKTGTKADSTVLPPIKSAGVLLR